MAPVRTYRGKARNSCLRDLDNRGDEDSLFERLLGRDKVKVFDSSSDQRDSTSSGSVSRPVQKTATTELQEPFVFFKNEPHNVTLEFPLLNSPTDSNGEENGKNKMKMKYKLKNGYTKLVVYEDRSSTNSSPDYSKPHGRAKNKRNKYTKKTRKVTQKKRKKKSFHKEFSSQQSAFLSESSKANRISGSDDGLKIPDKAYTPVITHELPSPIPSIQVGMRQVYACSTPIRSVSELLEGLGSIPVSFEIGNSNQGSSAEHPSCSNVQNSENASDRNSGSTEVSNSDIFSGSFEGFDVSPLSTEKSKCSVESLTTYDSSPSPKSSLTSLKIVEPPASRKNTLQASPPRCESVFKDEFSSSFHGFYVTVDQSLKNYESLPDKTSENIDKSEVGMPQNAKPCLRKTVLIKQSARSFQETKVLSQNSFNLDCSLMRGTNDEKHIYTNDADEKIYSESGEYSFSEQMSRQDFSADHLRDASADWGQNSVACCPSVLECSQPVVSLKQVVKDLSFRTPSLVDIMNPPLPVEESNSTVSDIFADSTHQPETDEKIVPLELHNYTYLDDEDVALECTIPYSSTLPCNLRCGEDNSLSKLEPKIVESVELTDDLIEMELGKKFKNSSALNLSSEKAYVDINGGEIHSFTNLKRQSKCGIVLRSMTRKISLYEDCPTISEKSSDGDDSVELNRKHPTCDKVLRSMTRQSSVTDNNKYHPESSKNRTACTELISPSVGVCQIIEVSSDEESDSPVDCKMNRREPKSSGPLTRLRSKKSIAVISDSRVTDEAHDGDSETRQKESIEPSGNLESKIRLSSPPPAEHFVEEEGTDNHNWTQCYYGLVRKSGVISRFTFGECPLPAEPPPEEILCDKEILNTCNSNIDEKNGEVQSVKTAVSGVKSEGVRETRTKSLTAMSSHSFRRRSQALKNRWTVNESANEHEDTIGDLEERIVLPGGRKYRRSMYVVRHLTTDAPEETSLLDQSQLKGRNYSSFVESIIDLQPLVDKSWVNEDCESLAIKHIGRRLSCLNLNTMDGPDTAPRYVKRRTSIKPPSSPIQDGEDVDYKKLLLKLCKQKEPCGFDELLGDNCLQKCRKIGEGVFGEVFIVERRSPKTGEDRDVVLKIIPIEGDFPVNGEPQKRYSEVYSELIISNVLDSLKNGVKDSLTGGFTELVGSWLIQGSYPERLLELWHEYNDNKGSENDSPEIFHDDQLFLVLEVGNAGADLEGYTFSTASQALSIFKQVILSLAVAESKFEFEHRDLHWGNILVSKTVQHTLPFTLEGRTFHIKTFGVKGTIIDYTLSSMTVAGQRIYNDIGKDPDMFIATGDYQFDIYRHMKEDLGNNWESFEPKTNVRWLHYLVDKLIGSVRYSRKTAKVHRDSMKQLSDIETWLLNCDSSLQVALNIMGDN